MTFRNRFLILCSFRSGRHMASFRTMPKPGTLMEVARRCAVSQSTVSRVLNNSRQGRFSVSPEVRQRILDVARELNYRPSVAARNLAVGKTKLVAVLGVGALLSDRVGPAEEAIGALSAVMDRAGYELCVQFLSERHGHFDPPPLRVDGVVAVGARNAQELQALEDSQIPYVSINGAVGPRGTSVNPDDTGGVAVALRHLADLGHRRVAYLDHAAVGADHPSVFERREAFAQVTRQMQLEVPELGLPLLARDQPWDSYYEPFLRRAVVQGGATAVLAYSHFGALSLLRTAHEMGLGVPRDFSVVCFNNAPVIRLFVPSLTAVDVPAARMGQVGAELLLEQMASEKPLPPKHLKLEESLIVRESSARPA